MNWAQDPRSIHAVYDASREHELYEFDSRPYVFPAQGHCHSELEVCVFEHSSVTMLYGGRAMTLPPDHMVVHWGMLPHDVLHVEDGALIVGVHVPLAWFLQWEMMEELKSRILNLELVIVPSRTTPCSDVELLRNCTRLIRSSGRLERRIALLEIEARLLRLSQSMAKGETVSEFEASRLRESDIFERAVSYISRHFLEGIRVADIAEAVGLSPRHLMRLFHQRAGPTVNEYITRLRLSHAQRLLIADNVKVIDAMYASGFTCTTHFYKVFREYAACTPAQYRKMTRSGMEAGKGKEHRTPRRAPSSR